MTRRMKEAYSSFSTCRRRSEDCWLPRTGWGRITLAKSRPEVNREWTDSGDAHEERGLKHGSASWYWRRARIAPS
jgi:hypothetical protein